MTKADELRLGFKQSFAGSAALFRAPGRANIIGEHTDYNEGFVLPAAVSFCCWAAASPSVGHKLAIHSKNMNETACADLRSLQPTGRWSDYPFGVASQFQEAGYALTGTNIFIDSDVPLGAGLSSSAAIEVATALALTHTSGLSIEPQAMAILCQRAENEFVGTKCGIMDQFTSCFGRAGNALFLDCRSLAHELIPVPQEISFVICNTMVKHELSSGEYNRRRLECEKGVEALRTVLPEIRSLRDVTLDQLEARGQILSPTIYKRCRHVISENVRVHEMVTALRSADNQRMSQLMTESHQSLRDDFQVSTPELDRMVELAQGLDGFWGGRMMGGGFGGCTINLVHQSAVPAFVHAMTSGYKVSTGLLPAVYVCRPADGAERLLTSDFATSRSEFGRQVGR